MGGHGSIGGRALVQFVVTDRRRKKVKARWLAHDTDLIEGRDVIKIKIKPKFKMKGNVITVPVIKGPSVYIEWGY